MTPEKILQIAEENDVHQLNHPAADKFCLQFAQAVLDSEQSELKNLCSHAGIMRAQEKHNALVMAVENYGFPDGTSAGDAIAEALKLALSTGHADTEQDLLDKAGSKIEEMTIEFISIFDEKPKTKGWYATLHCWDAKEGFFPGGHFWNGEEFEGGRPITNWIDKVFGSEEEAYGFARANDPVW